MQPDIKPVWQAVWQQVVSCKRSLTEYLQRETYKKILNRQVAGASPRTALGEHTALPRLSSWSGGKYPLPRTLPLFALRASLFGPLPWTPTML